MKKQILNRLLLLVFTFGIISSSFAQATAMQQVNNLDEKAKFLYDMSQPDDRPATDALPLNEVSAKALWAFKKNFEQTTPDWYALNNNSYLASFTTKDGRNARAMFGRNGYLYYAVNYGTEASLPKAERRIVKSNYVDYKITRVTEITSGGEKAWIVNLQDEDNIVLARIIDGSLDEFAHYQTHFTEKKRRGKIIIPQ